MEKQRLEAFSDATLAIIITIMVLELKVPHGSTWTSLLDTQPVFISYILSFALIGLFWYNHHLVFSKVTRVSNNVLWINLLVLFLQSLLPFATEWVGETRFASAPMTLYCLINGCTKILVIPLIYQLKKLHGIDSEFAKEFQNSLRLFLTIAMDLSAAVISAMGYPRVGFGVICMVAILWAIPNTKFQLKRAGS